MLDDLKYVHQRDSQDALGVVEKQWQQLVRSFEPRTESLEHGRFENVVFAGMGGSALGALISTSWPKCTVPFEVCRDYNLPNYVSDKTLFIASSYSGNTEETLSALAEAQKLGVKPVVITHGGKLGEIAKTNNYPTYHIPATPQPRFSALYGLAAVVDILKKNGLAVDTKPKPKLAAAADFLHRSTSAWLPTVPKDQNPAKKLAMELAGKSPVIYGGPLMAPAAYKWKISFNENAKTVAWWGSFPEFSHNEFIGWTSHPVDKPYGVVDLRSSFEHERIQRRFTVTAKLLSGKRPAPHTVQAEGSNILEHLVWTIAFGDFVSIYLALLNGIDPTPIELIERFKKEL